MPHARNRAGWLGGWCACLWGWGVGGGGWRAEGGEGGGRLTREQTDKGTTFLEQPFFRYFCFAYSHSAVKDLHRARFI